MDVRVARDIALAVRGRRRDLGWSQSELADRAGVSRDWIARFELGKQSVELELVLRVVAALGLRLSVELPGAAPHDRHADEADQLVDLDDVLAEIDREPDA